MLQSIQKLIKNIRTFYLTGSKISYYALQMHNDD